MNADFVRLLSAIRNPESMVGLSASDWDALLRHGRAAGLLSRMALDLRALDALDNLPEAVQRHMLAAVFVAERQIRAVRWEVHKLHDAIGRLDVPVVLLKGAAYVMGDLPPARGRIFGDIDILVPRPELALIEQQLEYHGWFGSHHDEYDQRYYREWMHEIPPLTHITRGSTLDVHHNILPLTARLKVKASALFNDLIPIEGYQNFFRLSNPKLILHSALHLFHEGEWGHGLRDLVDLHALLRCFGSEPGFPKSLALDAQRLNCERPLADALRYCQYLLGGVFNYPSPSFSTSLRTRSMNNLFLHGFRAAHPDLDTRLGRNWLFLLYIRSHWLRMPMRLLVPHLARKMSSR